MGRLFRLTETGAAFAEVVPGLFRRPETVAPGTGLVVPESTCLELDSNSFEGLFPSTSVVLLEVLAWVLAMSMEVLHFFAQ